MSPDKDAVFHSREEWVREIVREELRSKTERLTWDGATIREIVREEMSRDVKHNPASKPKTDLERAAEVAREVENYGLSANSAEYRNAHKNAAFLIRQRIEEMKPSPDWRKIAKGLARSLRFGRAWASIDEQTWDYERATSLAVYDAAVKETDQ